jgi:hypothetical protein
MTQKNQEIYRFCLSIPEHLKVQAKAKAALERTTLASIIQKFLQAWVIGEIHIPSTNKKVTNQTKNKKRKGDRQNE